MPGVQARGPHGALGRHLYIHVVADDERVLAAELEVRGDQALRSGQPYLSSRLLAPREGDHIHLGCRTSISPTSPAP